MPKNIQDLENDYFCLGIDGGGTKTALMLTDQDGVVIRTLKVGACNPVDIGFEQSTEILENAIYKICQYIPLSSVKLFAGIAGGISAGMQERMREFFGTFGFRCYANDSDIVNMVAAGLGTRDGITMILGTGICAFVQKEQMLSRVSGWGYLIDNGGSGYNLGRDALNAYFSVIDGTGFETVLTEEINAMYPGGIENIMAYIYSEGKKAVAFFAPAVFAAMNKGDTVAEQIFQRNMKEVVHIIETAARSFQEEKIPLVLAGGLTKQPCVLERIKILLSKPEQFDLQILTEEPVVGAVMLARDLKEDEE